MSRLDPYGNPAVMGSEMKPGITIHQRTALKDLFIFESFNDSKFLVAKEVTSGITSKMFVGENFNAKQGKITNIDIIEGNNLIKEIDSISLQLFR